jgi:hypothetical protein
MGVADTAVPAADPNVVPPAFQSPINPPEVALPPAPPVGAAPAAPPPAPAEPPKRRTRRVAEAAPAPTPAPAPAPAPPVAAEPTYPSVERLKKIGTLFLDCHPVGEDYLSAEDLYAVVSEDIAAKHGVPDWRLIDFKGAGVFASRLALLIDDGAEWGDVVVDTRTPEGAIAKAVLAARAALVVQGAR